MSDEHDDREQDTVSNERATHDEVGKTLAKMIISTVSQSSDSSKEHLYPCYDWHRLPNYSVTVYCDLSNLSMETLCDVELQVYSENDLDDEHDHENVRK